MNVYEIEQMIENMSDEELQAILDTQYPEELEKQAEAQLASGELADALFAYGAVMADTEFFALDDSLSKEASAELAQATEEIEGMVNAYVEALGLAEIEDGVELQKEAQAAAGIILSGYMTQLEKIAAEGDASTWQKFKDKASAAGKYLKDKASAAGAYVKEQATKHPYRTGAIGLGAAGAIGGAAYALKKRRDKKKGMKKQSSEVTVDAVTEEVIERMLEAEAIEHGMWLMEKQAEDAKETLLKRMGAKIKGGYESVKKYLKESPRASHGLAAAGGLGAGGAAMHMYHRRKQKKGR